MSNFVLASIVACLLTLTNCGTGSSSALRLPECDALEILDTAAQQQIGFTDEERFLFLDEVKNFPAARKRMDEFAQYMIFGLKDGEQVFELSIYLDSGLLLVGDHLDAHYEHMNGNSSKIYRMSGRILSLLRTKVHREAR